jgi:hypothetical protein
MNKMKKFSLILAGLLLCASGAFGQTLLTMTTLSAAVNGGASSSNSTSSATTPQWVQVTSATGISAPAPNTGAIPVQATSDAQSYLWVDRELMQVKAVSSTNIQVIRGVESTQAAAHASSALVFVIPSSYLSGNNTRFLAAPQGSCTRANELYLPLINFASGIISDCLGGQWVNGDSAQTTRTLVTGSTSGANGYRYPEPGGTAYTALQTSGTAPAANTQIECSELDLPFSMYLSGLGPLNGTTVGTDKHWVLLYDSAGAVLANSATAGATTSTASIYQKYSFVTPYYAVGPARYFACYGSNGTTDTIRHAVTGTNDNILGGAVTGQTFGTAAAITVPSSFTTAKVPYFLTF